jgi:hypothetical protein
MLALGLLNLGPVYSSDGGQEMLWEFSFGNLLESGPFEYEKMRT